MPEKEQQPDIVISMAAAEAASKFSDLVFQFLKDTDEWLQPDEPQHFDPGTVYCGTCFGSGIMLRDKKPSKRNPPKHEDDCSHGKLREHFKERLCPSRRRRRSRKKSAACDSNAQGGTTPDATAK